mgnify:CR=1 FL=1
MSEALTRVIEEQQRKIDQLQGLNDSYCKSLATVFTKHDELFEQISRMVDGYREWRGTPEQQERYRKLCCEVRLGLMDAGYCLSCYSFVCECDE